MNREKRFENRIYSIAIPDRDYSQAEREVEEGDRPRGGIAWFIPNSPPLPNDDYNYRRYRRGLERQSEIEMMLIDHQWQARRGQGRVRVAPQARGNVQGRDRIGVRIRIQNMAPPSPVPASSGISFPRWSLFQVWNNLAYVTCSVPYRVVWDDQEGKYVIKYSRVQRVLCGIQYILSSIEMISSCPKFVKVFSNGENPLMYVQFGSLVLFVAGQLCYMKTTIFGKLELLQVHTYGVNAGAPAGYQIKMGKIMTIISSAGYSMYLCGCLALDLALYTFRDQEDWNWGIAEFIQTFACYTRKVFIWGTDEDCPDDTFVSLNLVPGQEMFYGCVGILTFVSAALNQIHTTLIIMSSCVSLLSASHSLTRASGGDDLPRPGEVHGDENHEEQRPLVNRYEFLEKFSGKISSFVGLMFLLALGVMGLSLPNVLEQLFNNYELSTMRAALPIVMMIIACLGACVSAMQIDAIEDKMTEMDNIEQLPNDIRRLIIYLHRLFKRSPGIGYRGLFVMNFVYLVTYCGAVGGLIAFTYEHKTTEERSYNGYN